MPPIDLSEGTYTQTFSDPNLITANNTWPASLGIAGYRTADVTSATGVDARTILTSAGFAVNVIAS